MPHLVTLVGCALIGILMAATVLVTVLLLDRWHTGGRPAQPGWTINRRYRGAVYVSTWARQRRPTRLRSQTRAVLLHRAGVKR